MEFSGLAVSALRECVDIGEYILYLNFGVPDVLLEEVDSVFGLQRMKTIETASFLLDASLQFLETVIGRFHLAMDLLGQALQSLETVKPEKKIVRITSCVVKKIFTLDGARQYTGKKNFLNSDNNFFHLLPTFA